MKTSLPHWRNKDLKLQGRKSIQSIIDQIFQSIFQSVWVSESKAMDCKKFSFSPGTACGLHRPTDHLALDVRLLCFITSFHKLPRKMCLSFYKSLKETDSILHEPYPYNIGQFWLLRPSRLKPPMGIQIYFRSLKPGIVNVVVWIKIPP